MSKFKLVKYFALALTIGALILAGLPTARAAAPVTVQVWLLIDSKDTLDKMMADFNASHTDIQVQFSYKGTDPIKESLRQVLNTDAAPDVFFNWGASGLGLGGYYIRAGGVEPIQRYYDKYNWAARFSKAEIAASSIDGKVWAMPWTIHTMGFFYLKDTWNKAGLTSEPTTYADLQAANDKLVKAGVTPLETGGKFGWMPMRLVDSLLETACGAAKHDALKTMTADWSKEQCVTDAFTQYKMWVDKGWLNKDFLSIDPTTEDVHAAVYKGDATYYYEGDWIIPKLDSEGLKQDDLGFFYFPTGTNRVSFFTEGLFMASNSKHKDEAAAFMDWVSSPDIQLKYQSLWGGLPPTQSLSPPTGPLNSLINTLLPKAIGVYIPTDQSLPLDAVNTLFRLEADLAQGVAQPADAGAKMQAAINNYLSSQTATAAPTAAATKSQ